MAFKVPVPIPVNSLRRIRKQPGANALADANNWQAAEFPFSTQQEISILSVPSNATLSTWLAGPPAHPYMFVRAQDTNHVLPYTTLEFTLIADDVGPSPNTAFQCNMGLDTGMTSAQARDSVVQQINAFAADFGRTIPNLRSLRAVPVVSEPSALIIRMPFGMLGFPVIAESTPLGTGLGARTAGVDNALAFGILGKRRHIYGVRDALNGPYYGPVPPT